MDFIVDGLATGRMLRILRVVDAYTRERLALEADTSMGSGRVTRVLEREIAEHGRPENLRSDNGPEFTSRRMLGWAADWEGRLVHIQPGRPMQNGHVESFHGRLRDECLNTRWSRTLNDVRCPLDTWREEDNGERPHSSLDTARQGSSDSPSPNQLQNRESSSDEWLSIGGRSRSRSACPAIRSPAQLDLLRSLFFCTKK